MPLALRQSPSFSLVACLRSPLPSAADSGHPLVAVHPSSGDIVSDAPDPSSRLEFHIDFLDLSALPDVAERDSYFASSGYVDPALLSDCDRGESRYMG